MRKFYCHYCHKPVTLKETNFIACPYCKQQGNDGWAEEIEMTKKDKTKKQLEAENQALQDRLDAIIKCNPANFKELHYKDGKLQCVMEGNDAIAALVVKSFKGILDDAPAPNYVEMLWNVGDEQVIFTIQRPDGKTPNTLRVEAEAKLNNLKATAKKVARIIGQAHVARAINEVWGSNEANILVDELERQLP